MPRGERGPVKNGQTHDRKTNERGHYPLVTNVQMSTRTESVIKKEEERKKKREEEEAKKKRKEEEEKKAKTTEEERTKKEKEEGERVKKRAEGEEERLVTEALRRKALEYPPDGRPAGGTQPTGRTTETPPHGGL